MDGGGGGRKGEERRNETISQGIRVVNNDNHWNINNKLSKCQKK